MSARWLIALDGSPEGDAALELGLRWSRRFQATLFGLAVVDEDSIRRPEPLPIGASYFKARAEERRLGEARARADALLAGFEKRCAAAGARYEVQEDFGSPDERVLTDAHRCDLIFLARGDKTVERILRRTPRPVVAVPAHLPEGDAVLIAYDGSPQAARASQSYRWLLGNPSSRIHVLSVHPDQGQAAERARIALDYLRTHGISAEEHALPSRRPPEEAILRVAREVEAGLVVMGAYGRPRLREALLGSVTRSLLRESPLPLFLDH